MSARSNKIVLILVTLVAVSSINAQTSQKSEAELVADRVFEEGQRLGREASMGSTTKSRPETNAKLQAALERSHDGHLRIRFTGHHSY